jgi:serine/threonine protein kinase
LKKKEKIIKFLEKEYDKEISQIEPDENFIPEDFDIIKQIGEGTFGKIFCIEWPKNKKKYAMKKMILRTMDELSLNQEKTNLLFNFIKKTNSNGVIKLYGDQCVQKNEAEYIYYVLMELASIDWENEIKKRSESKKYYSEGELNQILNQLITSFALLQKNNITHRDIKPQNILIVNDVYKICDFGEAKIITTDGVIQQSIRGTELYMSPILFKALNARQKKVVHNTYKSDVFSLGMCILLAATLTFQSLYDIRELDKMENVKNVLVKYLIAKYSYNFVGTLLKMLEVNENLRPDFIELEKNIIGH